MAALTLTAPGWFAADLNHDPEALAWLEQTWPTARVQKLVLVAEGVLDVWTEPRARLAWRDRIFWAHPECPHCLPELVPTRRRYAGPVPPQVLAAFS